jgi:hypothetical protein
VNLSPTEFIEHTNISMKAKTDVFHLLLFELIHDDPIAWLAMRDAINKLTPSQKRYLKKVLE